MKIAIVFGGLSFEHEISIVSSISMKDVLKNELIYFYIDAKRDIRLVFIALFHVVSFTAGLICSFRTHSFYFISIFNYIARIRTIRT